ncbi:hypothetical protein Tco_1343666 [Tanacetum coccineum]
MESKKKSIDERALSIKREKAWTESKEQDTSSRSGNDAHADDADIRPIYEKSHVSTNKLLKSISFPTDINYY